MNEKTKTTKFLHKICKCIYLCCLPNFWTEKLACPDKITKLMDRLYLPNNVILFAFLISEYAAIFTQKHLNQKHAGLLTMFCISHTLMYSSYLGSIVLYQKEIRNIVYSLAISLKEVFNDEKVEAKMIKKAKIYAILVILNNSLAVGSYGLEGFVQAITTEATFTTVITAWPGPDDVSFLASIARLIVFFIWILFILNTLAIYILVLVLTICLSHQYENLQQYFYRLNNIFEGDLEQSAKEAMYESSLKVGLKLHGTTLRCTKDANRAFQIVYCGQIILSTIVLTLLLIQLTGSDRSLSKIMTVLTTASSVLFSTGMFMWNAGDITVEASRLPTAMFLSGWHNCRETSSGRVRKLLVRAMAQGQVPVIMKVFGIFELSYASYVTIVRSSYSVFSVLY